MEEEWRYIIAHWHGYLDWTNSMRGSCRFRQSWRDDILYYSDGKCHYSVVVAQVERQRGRREGEAKALSLALESEISRLGGRGHMLDFIRRESAWMLRH